MKKLYSQPTLTIKSCNMESLLTTASPGADGEYDPNESIDAKQGFFDDELDFGSDFGK